MATLALPFRPGVTTVLEVDDRNLLFCARHRAPAVSRDAGEQIRAALERPIGCPPLRSRLRAHHRVVVIVDDATRPTPAARILPYLLAQIGEAGIPEQNITIFMALGTHRPMTEDELVAKLGSSVYGRYRLINREYRDGDFVHLGQTPSGTPVEIDRAVLEADFRIAIGNVVPHMASGWGGGSKIILPGVCSQRTTDAMHILACTVQPVLEVIGVRDNRPRAEMDAVAAQAGLDFIVNTVLDERQQIIGVFAGHFVEAHRQAVACAEQVLVTPIPAQADILVISAAPSHMSYWQAVKPYTYAHLAVREGGAIVFLLDGSEGLVGDAPVHEPTVRRYLPLSFAEQKAAAERGEVEDLAGLNVPMYHALLRDRVQRTFCVSHHLTDEEIAFLGFERAPSAQIALDNAYRLLGRDARVGVIPLGSEVLARPNPPAERDPA